MDLGTAVDWLLNAFAWFQHAIDTLTAIGFAWTFLALPIALLAMAAGKAREWLRSPDAGGGPSRRRRS